MDDRRKRLIAFAFVIALAGIVYWHTKRQAEKAKEDAKPTEQAQ